MLTHTEVGLDTSIQEIKKYVTVIEEKLYKCACVYVYITVLHENIIQKEMLLLFPFTFFFFFLIFSFYSNSFIVSKRNVYI